MRRIVIVVLALAFAMSSMPRAAFAAQDTGSISGVAQSSGGQPLGSHTVRLRSVQTAAVVATTTTNAAGNFAFTGLVPGSYVAEIVNGGQILGASSIVTVVSGGNATVAVTAASTALVGGAIATPVLILLLAAGAAGAAGIIVAAQDEASPSR